MTGQPLNCTDIEVGPEGAVYFTTGGRGTQGGLYRVSWNGARPESARVEPPWVEAVKISSPLASFSQRRIAELRARNRDAGDRALPSEVGDPEQSRTYESTSRWEGGYSFAGYLDYMVQELVALLTEHERNQMLGRGEIYPFPTRVLVRELNIDREIGNVARLTQTNLAWASGLNLTRGEIGYGIRLSCEFSSDDGERWMNTVSSYLVAVFPGLKQLFTDGLIEWLKGCVDPSIPRFMAMGLVFEALYRLTAHLKGYSVLQKSIRRADASLKFQYRMLDSRPWESAPRRSWRA